MNNKKLLKEAYKNKVLSGIIKEGSEFQHIVYDNNGQKLDVYFTYYPGKMGDQENPPEHPDIDISSITDENGAEVDISEDVLESIKEMAADSISHDEPDFSDEDLEENNEFEVKEYKFKVKHDNGVKKLKTKASSLEAAKKIIMNAEGCPEGALELVSEMKKTYGQDGKSVKTKYQKHLRPAGKKIANAATRKVGKEISKNAEKDIDESHIRKIIKSLVGETFEPTLIKESINIGDTVMNNGNFYKVISEPFTAVDNGLAQFAADNDGASPPKDVDLRSYYTAIRVKNIDTGNESKGNINYFKKINPEDIEGLKQAKLAQDAADKIKKEKDDAERKASWAKHVADMQAKEKERISSKGDIDLAKKIIADWENSADVFEYKIESHDELTVNCFLYLDDNEDIDYNVEFNIKYDIEYSGDPEWPDSEIESTLDLVNIYKGKDLVYKGRAEFLDLFDKKVKPWVESNNELVEKAEQEYSDWHNSY